MRKQKQAQLAETFRSMHHAPRILLLPNAWDAMSARIFEAAGFVAIATTSGGVAWALGFPDGEQAPWDEVVAATRRIARAVDVPITADIEGGYGRTPNEVTQSVTDVIRAGAVGINLEDGTHESEMPIRRLEDAVERIRAAREAARTEGVSVVINARTDVYLKQVGDPGTRFAETVRRSKAYLAAGADCIFPFGLTDLNAISDLATALKAPINVVGRPGMPGLADLKQKGVARVSTALGPALAAMSFTRQIAEALLATERFDALETAIRRAEAQRLFSAKSEDPGKPA